MNNLMRMLLLLLVQSLLYERCRQYQWYMIPNTHDDLGWLLTIDEYYQKSVKLIYESVLSELAKWDESKGERLKKKFVQSNVGFLKIFLNEKPEEADIKKELISRLIKRGQWEFVNGGVSQPDEACTSYEDLIENHYSGLRYLKKNFNVGTPYAWQLDPFGHSTGFFYLASKFGQTHVVFGRQSDAEKSERRKARTLQFRVELPENQSIIAHSLTSGYCAPSILNCEGDCDFAKFKKRQLETFLRYVAGSYRYDPLVLLGCDFSWKFAKNKFDYLDKVFGLYSNIQYSLFSEYAQQFESQMKDLPVRKGDFFVYQEEGITGDSWSGFFTTKPNLKYLIRNAGVKLRAVKNMLSRHFIDTISSEDERLSLLERINDISEDFGMFLHHDTITGTSVKYVDLDYKKLITMTTNKLESLFMQYIFKASKDVPPVDGPGQAMSLGDASAGEVFYKIGIYNPSLTNFAHDFQLLIMYAKEHPEIVVKMNGQAIESDIQCIDAIQNCRVVFLAPIPPLAFQIITFERKDKA